MDDLLHLLPSLIALVEEANVTRAARRMGISQPRMSARLAQLRAVLADPLLVASSGTRGLVATDRAQVIADEARDVVRRIGELRDGETFDPITTVRTFRISANDNAAAIFGLPLANAVAKAAGPGVRVAIHHYDANRLSGLESGQLDLALGTAGMFETMPGLKSRVIVRDRFVSAVRKGSDIAEDIDAFCRRSHVLVSGDGGGFEGPVDRALASCGRARPVVLSVQTYLLAIEAVVANDLVATLPSFLLRRAGDRLEVFRTPLDLPPFTLSAAWHGRIDGSASHRWLRARMAELSDAE